MACFFSGTADGKGNNIRSEVFALDEQKGTGGRGTEQKHTQYHGKNMVNSYKANTRVRVTNYFLPALKHG